MQTFLDQLGRTVSLTASPQKIICLVPSLTELLFDLGLEDEVCGITSFCARPPHWSQQKIIVGGPKTVDLDAISRISPDLVIANKEENTQMQIQALAEKYPVWISDIHTLDEALSAILQIGSLVHRQALADALASKIKQQFDALPRPNHRKDLRCAYLIWRKPYMAAGSGTFIHSMMSWCGMTNVFAAIPRYPIISLEQLQSAACRILLLSSEPYPFSQKHADALQPLLPGTRIILVDGTMFSWYGNHLLQSPAYFDQLLQEIQG